MPCDVSEAIMQVTPLTASANSLGFGSAMTQGTAMGSGIQQAAVLEYTSNTSASSTEASSGREELTYQMINMNINGVVQSVLVPLALSFTTPFSFIPSTVTANPSTSHNGQRVVNESDLEGLKVISPGTYFPDQEVLHPVHQNKERGNAAAVHFMSQSGLVPEVQTARAILSVTHSKPACTIAKTLTANVASRIAGMPSVTSVSSHDAASVVLSTAQNIPECLSSIQSSNVNVSSTSFSILNEVPMQTSEMQASTPTATLISGSVSGTLLSSSTTTDCSSQDATSSVTAEDMRESSPQIKIDSVYSLNSAEIAMQNKVGKQACTEMIKESKHSGTDKMDVQNGRADRKENIKRLLPQRMAAKKKPGECSCCVMHLRPQHLPRRKRNKVFQNVKEHVKASCASEIKQIYKPGPLCYKRKQSGLDIGQQNKRKFGDDAFSNIKDKEVNAEFGGDFLRQIKLCSVKLDRLYMRGRNSLHFKQLQELQSRKQTRLTKKKFPRHDSSVSRVKERKAESKSKEKTKRQEKTPMPKDQMSILSPASNFTSAKPKVTEGGWQVLAAIASRVFSTAGTRGQQSAAIISSPKPLMLGCPMDRASGGVHESGQRKHRYLLIRSNTGGLMVTPLADAAPSGEASTTHASLLATQPGETVSKVGHSMLHTGKISPNILDTSDIYPKAASAAQGSHQMFSTASQNLKSPSKTATANGINAFGDVTVKSEPMTCRYGDEVRAGGIGKEPELTMRVTKEEQEAHEKRIGRLKALLKAQEKKLEDFRRKRNAKETLKFLSFDD